MARLSRAVLPPPLDLSEAPIEELLESDVIAEVTEDLKNAWFATDYDEYRQQLATVWSPLQFQMPTLETEMIGGRPMSPLIWDGKHRFCNKATAFYWAQTAQKNPGWGPLILGSIWNEWFKVLGSEPQIELDSFFAIPIRPTEHGPKTISELIWAHASLCIQVQDMLQEQIAKAEVTPTKAFANINPDPRYFKLLPLCEALVVVFDEYIDVKAERHGGGLRHYNDVAAKQSILLVRTGKEDGLSAPIRFDSLKIEALPLVRDDSIDDIDMIRVPLLVGVRFVAHLFLREEAAFPARTDKTLGGIDSQAEQEHPTLRRNKEALASAKHDLMLANQRGLIKPHSSVAELRKVLRIHRAEDYPPGHFDPFPFKFGWG